MPGPWERYQSNSGASQEGPWSRYGASSGQQESSGRQNVEGALRLPSQFAQGANQGIASVAGTPVSLVNNLPGLAVRFGDAMSGGNVSRGLESVGVEDPQNARFADEAVGGITQLTRAAESAGFINPEDQPRNLGERITRRVGEEVGASVLPSAGVLRAGSRIAPAVRGARPPSGNPLGPAIDEAATRPGVFAAADAASSVASGTGAAIGQEVGGDTGEVIGQIATPLAAAGLAQGVRSGFRGPTEAGRAGAAQDAAQRAGTSLTAGQLGIEGARATPGTYIERLFSFVPGANIRMGRALERQQDEIGQRVAQISDDLAAGSTPERAGATLQTGIRGFRDRGRARAEALYSRVDEFVPQQTPAEFANARRVASEIQSEIPSGRLGENATLADPRIRRLLEDLSADEPRTYADLSRVRTRVGRQLNNDELVSSQPELERLYGALTEDMAQMAQSAGPQAQNAWQRANRFYRAYRGRLDDQLQPLLRGERGNLPEQAFGAVERGGRNGATRLRAIRSSVTDDEWDVISSAVLRRLGRARSGQQDELGEVFSTETFLTNWNNLDAEARNALFGGSRYRGMRRDIDAIAETARRVRESSQVLANPSQSAVSGANAAAIFYAIMNPTQAPMVAGGAIASDVAARLLTNRRFVRWLAQATKLPVERAPSYLGRLTETTRNQGPQYAEDVQTYMDALGQALEGTAQGNDEGRNRQQEQPRNNNEPR